jgi:hypothetical protein
MKLILLNDSKYRISITSVSKKKSRGRNFYAGKEIVTDN